MVWQEKGLSVDNHLKTIFNTFINYRDPFKPFQNSVAFHRETSHLIWIANEMVGFYMKCNTWLKRFE